MRTGLCKDMFITWIGKMKQKLIQEVHLFQVILRNYKFADSSKKEIHGI